ncbi:MAG: STAS domain-containing protein [Lachnospiraceae bacterium]|nr:STAS domain-containing protein [Lachnospiraceae bacterium]
MEQKKDVLRPKLWKTIKGYDGKQFAKDVVAGIIVAIIALPLSIALALASGVGPEQGIYTAIIAGFLISFFGGSRVQIAGPTAAFATIVAGVVAKQGMEGLVLATLLAGIFLIIMGVLRLGSLIRFIPYTITTGFTAGIAITILVGQLKDFFGVAYQNGESPVETVEKVEALISNFGTFNWQALLVGAVCLLVQIVWPYINKLIPGSLIAVFVGIAMVTGLGMQVNTIGDLYTISNALPQFVLPDISFTMVKNVLPDAFTIAILAAIESLLSCVVADSIIHSRHNSNMELVAQGIGNIGSALFGGIPATGAIARTAANIKNGGRTPVAGMVHAIVLVLVLVVLMPYAALIPMPTIAAILFMVAYNMSGWRTVVHVIKTSPKSDIAVMVVTFLLTVIFDLVVAIEFGMILACILFMKRMSDVTNVESWKYIENGMEDSDAIDLKVVPENTLVYEISGPLFFGAADKLLSIELSKKTNCLILRMRSVSAIDATAVNSIEKLIAECKQKGITIILSHVNEQPESVLKKSGIYDIVTKNNICPNIDAALERAAELVEK